MKHMLLLGDSIRLSYRSRVQERLKGEAVIHGPDDNCRFAAYTLFNLHNWATEEHYDVIQWNNGQWDTCHMLDGSLHTPLEGYLEYEQRIARILAPRCDRLIFATTTPVKGDMFAARDALPRRNEDIAAYNHAAIQALRPMGVEILDLNALVLPELEDCICDDLVHLGDHGIELCAARVAANATT